MPEPVGLTMLRIGTIQLERPLALAPMESVGDQPFRLLCKSFGADIVYTEFANAEAIVRDVTRTLHKMQVNEAARAIAV
ncbi:MAG: tRNA-dihydrouridine synthase, partial [Candidatus Hydrogenedentes bacterium]|nr:tRNA-dihydrouridine synthase [Candidatus Hydrogenedentota bacterium]